MTRADRVLAVLDTLFWVLAYRAEIAANCLDLFEIVVPKAVEEEILAGQPGVAAREYPYSTLFRHLKHELRSPTVDVTPLSVFGPGEAEAIALATELNAVLLINERPGLQFARNLGLDVASVPSLSCCSGLRVSSAIGQRDGSWGSSRQTQQQQSSTRPLARSTFFPAATDASSDACS